MFELSIGGSPRPALASGPNALQPLSRDAFVFALTSSVLAYHIHRLGRRRRTIGHRTSVHRSSPGHSTFSPMTVCPRPWKIPGVACIQRRGPERVLGHRLFDLGLFGGGDGTRTHEPPDCQSGALPAELRPRSETPRSRVVFRLPHPEPDHLGSRASRHNFARHPVGSGARP